MKIAYILQDFPCLSETFILREITELIARGHPITVFALRDPGETCRHQDAIAVARSVVYGDPIWHRNSFRAFFHFVKQAPRAVFGILLRLVADTVAHPLSFARVWRFLPAAFTFARKIQQDDISRIHAHFAYIPADIARIAGAVTGCPVTVSAHAWDIHCQSAAVLRRRLLGAQTVIACSRDGQEALRRKLGPAVPVHLVSHGLQLKLFVPGSSPTGTPLLLAVGRLTEKKAFGDLIKACGVLQDTEIPYHCLIVGEGPERERLQSAISTRGLSESVELKGAVTQAELMPIYADAILFIHPATATATGDREGISNVLLEAMAMRVPVIATASGGIPDLVEDGHNGFLAPANDPAGLADRIATVLAAPEERLRIAEAGRRHVHQHYDIVKNVDKLEHIFSALDAKHGD